MHIKMAFIASTLISTMVFSVAEAQDTNEAPPSASESNNASFDSFFWVGTSLSNRTEYKFKFQGDTLKTSDNDKGAIALGIDSAINIHENFAVSFLFDYAEYAYSSGGDNDSILTLAIAPRLQKSISDKIRVWGSLGFGFIRNQIKTNPQIQDDLMFTYSKRDATSFGLIPRLGIDFKALENVAFRFQIAYSSATFKYNFNVRDYPSLTDLGNGDVTATRSWLTAGLGAMWGF